MSSNCNEDKPPKESRRKRSRKPHNARVPRYASLSDIVEAVGAESRKLPTPDGYTTMTRKERVYRLMIERALRGGVRDLVHLVRLMAKYPNVTVGREEWHYFMARKVWDI